MRKASTLFSQPPSSLAPPPPGNPPPPPRSQAPPPPPTSPPSISNGSQSLAMQAAIRAAGQASPAAAPPPPPNPPPSASPHRAPSPPASAPPPPISRSHTQSQQPLRSMLDPSSYTLSSNGTSKNSSTNRTSEPGRQVVINDSRWRFQDESMFPKPRDFIGGSKKYRAGRGSSVPLDLTSFT